MTEKQPSLEHGRPGRPAGFAREDAVEAAMNFLWKHGYPAVTASDLAAAMKLQRSSFYNSFGSREAVFREALARYAAAAPDAPLDRLLPGQPAAQVLAAVFRRVCTMRAADSEARGCLTCNGVVDLVGVDDQLGPPIADAVRRRIASVEALLRQAVAQGELAAPADPAAAAQSVVAFLIGLNSLSKVVRSEAQLWAMCKTFLAGLGVSQKDLEAPADPPA